MVLGRESRVRGIPFGNSELAGILMDRSGAFSPSQSHERVFVNRFGQSIYEDIIIARRIGEPTEEEAAREVACSALRQGLTNAAGDVKSDVENALIHAGDVKPSPLFNKSALV
jgi:hypothetical protein